VPESEHVRFTDARPIVCSDEIETAQRLKRSVWSFVIFDISSPSPKSFISGMRRADCTPPSLPKEAYTLWPRHLSSGSYDHLLTVFRRAGFGPPITMEGGLPSTRTVLGMIAAGLTIALVDPALQQVSASRVVFRPLAGSGVFTETGVVYRQGDPSPILASFLHELRATPRIRAGSAAIAPFPRPRKGPGPAGGRSGRERKG